MAEIYPPGTLVQALHTQGNLITSGTVYEVVSENCYYDQGNPKNGNDEAWVWIRQNNGRFNGWKPEYFKVVAYNCNHPLPDPEFGLDEIHAATAAYSKLTKNKSRA